MMKNNHFTEPNVIAAREKDIKMLRHFGTYDFIKGQTKFFVGLMTNGGEALEDFGCGQVRLWLEGRKQGPEDLVGWRV